MYRALLCGMGLASAAACHASFSPSSAAAMPIHSASPPSSPSLCMLCVQTLEPRIGAAQSVSGASAEPQDRMLHGIKPGAGAGAGWDRRACSQTSIPAVLWSTSRKRWAMLGWVPTSHEAAFHSAEPSFLSLAHFPHFLRAALGQD